MTNEAVPSARRMQLLARVPSFAGLPANALQELAASLREECFPAGCVVLTEGDVGDRLYIIERGRVEVSAAGPGGLVALATLEAGEMFGEIALLCPTRRRHATVTALTPLTGLSLAAPVFEKIVAAHPAMRAAVAAGAETLLTAKFLKQASPFATLEAGRLRWLAGRVHRQPVAAGEPIIRQGAPGEACYLVRTGSVEVVANEAGRPERQLTTLGPGMLFGEAALLTGAPRNATVRALEAGEVLALRRADVLAAMDTAREVGAQLFALLQLRERPRQAAGVLTQVRGTADGESITVLKNPRGGTYFQLSAQGAFLWERLDGRHTLRDLALDLLITFKSFSPHTIAELVGKLAVAGFVETRALRADVIETVAHVAWWQRALGWGRRVLQWQVAATGTDALSTRMYRTGIHRLYTRWGQVILGAIALGGLAVFIFARGGAAAARASPGAWLWFLIPAYLLAVVVHEAGHAFTVKAFGREVPRVGAGWYWFGPVAFVDTSDMWLAERWPRIAVSLAGPYANVVLAGAAALAGWAAPAAALAGALWQFALVSYVVVLVNLCPLFEYDGYYVLMDWLERPNLRRRSMTWLGKNLLPALRHPSRLRGHWVELWFGVASLAYVGFAAVLTVMLFRVFVEPWLAGWLPPVLAASLAWVVAGGMAFLAVLLVASELRDGRAQGGFDALAGRE